MPFYLHQWTYKDREIHAMVTKPQNREEVVRVATEAFGGKLHMFFLSFGEYDGLSISEFNDQVTAMACMMSIAGQGALDRLRTTPLLTSTEMQQAMGLAQNVLTDYTPPSKTG